MLVREKKNMIITNIKTFYTTKQNKTENIKKKNCVQTAERKFGNFS